MKCKNINSIARIEIPVAEAAIFTQQKYKKFCMLCYPTSGGQWSGDEIHILKILN